MFQHNVAHTGLSQYDSSANPGLEKWAFAGGGFVGPPAIGTDGTIYFGSGTYNLNAKLKAVNPNGTLKWAFATGNYALSSPAIGTDGTIYAGSSDGYLYGLNPDGTLKWNIHN